MTARAVNDDRRIIFMVKERGLVDKGKNMMNGHDDRKQKTFPKFVVVAASPVISTDESVSKF
jgi:hypothetical protein